MNTTSSARSAPSLIAKFAKGASDAARHGAVADHLVHTIDISKSNIIIENRASHATSPYTLPLEIEVAPATGPDRSSNTAGPPDHKVAAIATRNVPAADLTTAPLQVEAKALDARLASLSPQQRAILAQRLKEARQPASGPRPGPEPIPRRADRETAPLSFAQELLWLVEQLQPESTAYNVPRALRIEGRLDLEALRRSIEAIITRHEVLRSTIQVTDEGPIQVIAAPARWELPLADLSGHPEPGRELERLMQKEADRDYDLSRDLMLQAGLIRMSESDHILLINLHHIASDGYSKGILFRELSEYYRAFARGEEARLSELPIQYADFASWQRARLQGDGYVELLNYWKNRLAGAPAILQLPTDRPRPTVQSFHGGLHRRELPGDLLAPLKDLCRERKATLFMTLLAAYKVFLLRYTGQDDIVVGTPIADRDRPEVAGLIGFFINTLVLRTDLAGDPTFRELIDRVRDTSLGAYDHQEMPFEKLVTELRPERDLSYTPLIQSLFSVGHVKGGHVQDLAPSLVDLNVTRLTLDRTSSKFDFTMGLTAGPDWLTLGCEYSTNLFDRETVERMLEHFDNLLRGVAADPDCRISRLPLLSEAERRRIAVEWNGPRRERAPDSSVPRSFEARVRISPDAVAVSVEGEALSYRELNSRANRLARHLQGIGVGPDVPVGICTGRAPELAVAILGTLKAGGMCFPLDPDYPSDRLAFMVDDSQAPVLLTVDSLAPALPANKAQIIRLDADWPTIAVNPDGDLPRSPTPDQAAYLLYTSGSTGIPKGVILTHQGLINHALAAIDLYGLTPSDRVLQFASLSFDISVEELLPSWCAGSTVMLRPADLPLSGPEFSRWLEREGISVVDLPTAFWQEWALQLRDWGGAPPATLRLVIVGGEKAQSSARAAWLQVGGGRIRWVNTYGPTETTVIATAFEPMAAGVASEDDADPPIGRPIANIELYILDPNLQLVPTGVPGEIYIGGHGLARGYLGRPELTAERFISNPFSDDPRARLYRTGDRARWRADGQIEFLGRADDQIKIRGFRVEPGEIATALSQHPAVKESLVVGHDDGHGPKTLVAYVVPRAGNPSLIGELRRFLEDRLPAFMVPSSFMLLEELPLNANGKVDRRALPDPERMTLELDHYAAPRNPTEERLATIWCDLLGLERVGIRDDFFELGGHSLLILRLWSRIRQSFRKDCSVNFLFQHRTIEQISEAFAREEESIRDAGSERTSPNDREGRTPLFCVDFAATLARHLNDVPIFPLEHFMDEILDRESIQEMARVYIRRMQQHQPRGPYRICGWCGSSLIAYEMARQLQESGEETALLVLMNPRHAVPPARKKRPPLLRRAALRTSRHLRTMLSSPLKSWPGFARERLRSIEGRLRRRLTFCPTPPSVSEWWQQRPKLQRALSLYEVPSYAGKATLFLLSEKVEAYNDADFGWSKVVTGGLERHVIPGSPVDFMFTSGVAELAGELEKCYHRSYAKAQAEKP